MILHFKKTQQKKNKAEASTENAAEVYCNRDL